MIIEVKYNVGDSIRYIERKNHEVWGPCPCCDGFKYITGADGEKYECPVCEGKGQVLEGELESEEEKTGTISSIHVIYDSNYHGRAGREPWVYYNIPQDRYNIDQKDIIERIFTEEEQLAYSD